MRKQIQRNYDKLLIAYLHAPNEDNLYKAYILGKECAKAGVTVSELIGIHFNVIHQIHSRLKDEGEPLLDSHKMLLETALAMGVSGRQTIETLYAVLTGLYEEIVPRFNELKTTKDKLQVSEDRFRTLVQTIPDIVYKVDPSGRFVLVNDAVKRLGYDPEELIGTHFKEILMPEDLESASRELVLSRLKGNNTGFRDSPKLIDERRTGNRKTLGLEVRLLIKRNPKTKACIGPTLNGHVIVEVNSSGMYELKNEDGSKEFIGTVGIIRDITRRKRTESEQVLLLEQLIKTKEELRLQSIRDPLTDLYNRRFMEDTFRREISFAKRHNTSLGLIMIDVDHFKLKNDEHGHLIGDEILKRIGDLLKNHVRDEDIACRYGGEEFLVLMPQVSKEAVVARAEQLRKIAEEELKIKKKRKIITSVTLSLGVAMMPENGHNQEDLINAADKALYSAKRKGRNRVEFTKT